MKPHRNILKLCAVLALVAWANVQVMACCWFPSHSKLNAVAVETSVPDCCEHAATTVSVNPDGAGSISNAANAHCDRDQSPALQSSMPSFDVTLAERLDLLQILSLSSTDFQRATVYRGSGPPSSLVFQRLLI